jgi:hypothetical protein
MKKIIVLTTLSLCSLGVFAQEATGLTSKKGEAILPEAKDWAISFDAVPFLNYMGNLFSGSTSSNASPGATWIDPTTMTVTGKLFKDEKTAYRATVRLGYNSRHINSLITDATQTITPTYPNPVLQREDTWKNSSTYFGVGGGIEKRRGKTRLQGFYGCEGLLWISGSKNSFAYGNNLSSTVGVSGNTTDFGTSATSTGSNLTTDPSYVIPARITLDKSGTTFGIGVRGFIGAEYFLFPKIAIGAEYGYGIGLSSTGEGKQKLESVGGSPAAPGEIEYKTGKSGGFGLDTDINGGTGSGTTQLKITFHF